MSNDKSLRNRDSLNYSEGIFEELSKKEHEVIGFKPVDSTEKNKNAKWQYCIFVFDEPSVG